jgi:hypothetical protein
VYWLRTPFASFPFTSPSVGHCVTSLFNWTLHVFRRLWFVCKGTFRSRKSGFDVRQDDMNRTRRQTSVDGGTNKQLYRIEMDQTSRHHPFQNLNRNFIEDILLCAEDLRLDVSQIRQNTTTFVV